MNYSEWEWNELEREKTASAFRGVTIAAIIAAILWGLLIAGCNNAWAINMDMTKIAMIESSNDPMAWNKKDDSRGLYQITPICLEDYNKYHPDNPYDIDDLWDVDVNTTVATWYLNKRIPAMLNYFGIPDTADHRIIAYNAGIGNLVKWYKSGGRLSDLPPVTQRYIKKYWGDI